LALVDKVVLATPKGGYFLIAFRPSANVEILDHEERIEIKGAREAAIGFSTSIDHL